jgi:hypothetical protein
MPIEEVSIEKSHYKELILDQVTTLHQERLAQHLDGGLNRWGIMISNGLELLNNVPQQGIITPRLIRHDRPRHE